MDTTQIDYVTTPLGNPFNAVPTLRTASNEERENELNVRADCPGCWQQRTRTTIPQTDNFLQARGRIFSRR